MEPRGQGVIADEILRGLLLLVMLSAPFSIAVSQTALGAAILLRLGLFVAGRGLRRTGLEIPLSLWLAWILVTLPAASDPAESIHHLRRWWLLPALWLFAETKTRQRRGLFFALALGMSGVATYGLLQGWGLVPVASEFVQMGKIPLSTNPMTAGAMMMIGALCALAFLLSVGDRRILAAAAITLPLTLWALLLVQSRAGWLGFLIGAFLLLLLRRPRWAWLLPLLLSLGLLFGPPRYRARFLSAFGPGKQYRSNWQRLYMWKTGWRILKEHPLTGLGDRDLRRVYKSHTPPEDRDKVVIYGHFHSDPVMFAVLWGAPGLALALAFLIWIPALQAGRLRRRSSSLGRGPPESEAWTRAGLAAWTGFMVAGMFEWYFGDAEVILLIWILTGLSLAGGGEYEEHPA